MMAITAEFPYKIPNIFDSTGLPALERLPDVLSYLFAYHVPLQGAPEARALLEQLTELVGWTNWSSQTLAQIIGSNDRAVVQALEGNARPLTRSAGIERRLHEVHAVVSRLYLLAGRDSGRTAQALSAPGPDGVTASELLIDRQLARAYLVAMRTLRPIASGDMMVGSYPLDPRRASIAVLDED